MKIRKNIIGRDINGKAIKMPVEKLSFRPSVYGVVIEKGKVLLSKQWDGYDFPGGGVEIGETVEEALVREYWEETGVKVKVGKVLACESSFFKFPSSGKCVQSILMYFKCRRIGGKLTTENFDETEKKYADMPEWIDIKKTIKLKFYNPVNSPKIIKDAIRL
jgi:8-oxo-dGTP pyrophosphatase MutT (NUDIX family)